MARKRIDLADLSLNEMRKFFASPFWKALMEWVKEDIANNKRDIVAGDIHIRTKDEKGLKYRTDESLRGGILGMELLKTYPEMLGPAIKAAREEAKDESTD